MGWVIWHDEADGRRVYVRRITPKFVSFTVVREDAYAWPTRVAARAALRGTGLSAYKVHDADPPAEAEA